MPRLFTGIEIPAEIGQLSGRVALVDGLADNLRACRIGVFGPGLSGWTQTSQVLTGHAPYVPAPTVLPTVDKLPAAERRRIGMPVKISMAIGFEE